MTKPIENGSFPYTRETTIEKSMDFQPLRPKKNGIHLRNSNARFGRTFFFLHNLSSFLFVHCAIVAIDSD